MMSFSQFLVTYFAEAAKAKVLSQLISELRGQVDAPVFLAVYDN